MSTLVVIEHPLVAHKLSLMRDKRTPTAQFRHLLREISLLMGYEAMRDLPTELRAIETPISAGTAPFVGSFRPESPLSAHIGKTANGTWQFKAVDTANLDLGNINCVRLTITPVTGTDGGGACGAPPVGKFYALPPCRVADTRTTTPPVLAANTLRNFAAAGVCSIT